MRPAVLKLALVLSLTVLVVDRQAEPVSSAEQTDDTTSWTQIVEAEGAETGSVEFLMPSR